MLILPLDEDSLPFRLCLYYGLFVLLLELVVPLIFHRQVRIKLPCLALRAPAVPLSTREFQQRRRALQQQVAALQRALAETPRRLPQKKTPLSSVSTSKKRAAASLSPTPSLASSTSSVKMTRSRSSRIMSKKRIEREESQPPFDADSVLKSRQLPMDKSLAGGFSFQEISENDEEEKNGDFQTELEDRAQPVNRKIVTRRESPTIPRRRPVRLVPEDVDGAGYTGVALGHSEAATRLEALIGVRRRQRAGTSQSFAVLPPPRARINSSALAPEPSMENSAPNEPTPPRLEASRHDEKLMEKDEEREESEQSGVSIPLKHQRDDNVSTTDGKRTEAEQSEPLTDFHTYCALFAAGGSAAAQQAVAKRKYHEAFEAEDTQANGSATTDQDRLKRPRALEQDVKQPSSGHTTTTHDHVDKRTHYEAFGSDNEQATDDGVATHQILDKRKHKEQQVFDTTEEPKWPNEETPRIVRRISFDNEVTTLLDAPSKEVLVQRSSGKRKRKQTLGMDSEDDEDTEWRDSLAFQPNRFRLAK